MPIPEPIPAGKPIDERELRAMRDTLVRKRFSGNARIRYADGSENELKSDNQMAAAIAAIDAELTHRSGTAPSAILISSTKGLGT